MASRISILEELRGDNQVGRKWVGAMILVLTLRLLGRGGGGGGRL